MTMTMMMFNRMMRVSATAARTTTTTRTLSLYARGGRIATVPGAAAAAAAAAKGAPAPPTVLSLCTRFSRFSRFSTQTALRSNTNKPSVAMAQSMPREYYEYEHDTLIKLASEGDEEAQKERLVREIMAVDEISWDDAQPKVEEISAANKSGQFMWLFPYYVGILGGGLGAVLSVPMVFHLDTALWFNENYVTTEVASDEDLETWLEVGSWTWNWMEPPLGGISFVLLALQFARAQMININFKPYTEFMLSRRANSLAAQYPNYNGHIVKQFSRGYAV